MFNQDWKKEIFTVPNLLSLIRLLLIPAYIGIYQRASRNTDYYLAASILGLSCITDWLDGKIARQYHMVSTVGKLLDPLADKLTQLSLLLALIQNHKILYPVLFLFLVKETFQLLCLARFAQRRKALPGALLAGKVCTTILFISMFLLVLFPLLPFNAVFFLALVDLLILGISFYSYIQAYFGSAPQIQDF